MFHKELSNGCNVGIKSTKNRELYITLLKYSLKLEMKYSKKFSKIFKEIGKQKHRVIIIIKYACCHKNKCKRKNTIFNNVPIQQKENT